MAEEWQASYSHAELEASRWSHRTLCGYIWSNMKPGDGAHPLSVENSGPCPQLPYLLADRIWPIGVTTARRADPCGRRPRHAGCIGVRPSRVEGVPREQAEAVGEAIRRELRRTAQGDAPTSLAKPSLWSRMTHTSLCQRNVRTTSSNSRCTHSIPYSTLRPQHPHVASAGTLGGFRRERVTVSSPHSLQRGGVRVPS